MTSLPITLPFQMWTRGIQYAFVLYGELHCTKCVVRFHLKLEHCVQICTSTIDRQWMSRTFQHKIKEKQKRQSSLFLGLLCISIIISVYSMRVYLFYIVIHIILKGDYYFFNTIMEYNNSMIIIYTITYIYIYIFILWNQHQ